MMDYHLERRGRRQLRHQQPIRSYGAIISITAAGGEELAQVLGDPLLTPRDRRQGLLGPTSLPLSIGQRCPCLEQFESMAHAAVQRPSDGFEIWCEHLKQFLARGDRLLRVSDSEQFIQLWIEAHLTPPPVV